MRHRVNDAVLIEAPLDELPNVVERAQALMAEASSRVLDGFELRSDAEIVAYPDRYMDLRGEAMWRTVSTLLEAV